MTEGPFAHSLPGKPLSTWEPLGKHLRDVGSGAAKHAERFGWAEAARVAGHLHDIGKVSAQFQAYIQKQATHGGDHATAGAREATKAYPEAFAQLLALIVAGHHRGLADPDEIERRLASKLPDYGGWETYAGRLPGLAALKPTRNMPAPAYPWIGREFSKSFLVRMLFSCLVDADFIATETFINQAAAFGSSAGSSRRERSSVSAPGSRCWTGFMPTVISLTRRLADPAVMS